MATDNLNSTASKKYVYNNDTVSLPKDTFRMSLRDSYEEGRKDEARFSFGKFWSSFASLSISFFMAYLTCDSFKFTNEDGSKIVSVVILIIGFILVAACVSSLLYSIRRSHSINDQRNDAVESIYAGLGLIVKKSQTRTKQKEIPVQTTEENTES